MPKSCPVPLPVKTHLPNSAGITPKILQEQPPPWQGQATHSAGSSTQAGEDLDALHQLTAASNIQRDLKAGNAAPYPSFPPALAESQPKPFPCLCLRSLKVLREPGRDLSGSAEFHLGFALSRNKVKFRNKSKAVVFALAGSQHREQRSLPNQGWESFSSLLSNHIQFGPGHLSAQVTSAVTFLLAVVVMARPLGSSRAVLCFFISCTDTTGITT